MGLPRNPFGVPWSSHGAPKQPLCVPEGSPEPAMGFPGNPLEFLRNPLKLPWGFHGAPIIETTHPASLALPMWAHHESVKLDKLQMIAPIIQLKEY